MRAIIVILIFLSEGLFGQKKIIFKDSLTQQIIDSVTIYNLRTKQTLDNINIGYNDSLVVKKEFYFDKKIKSNYIKEEVLFLQPRTINIETVILKNSIEKKLGNLELKNISGKLINIEEGDAFCGTLVKLEKPSLVTSYNFYFADSKSRDILSFIIYKIDENNILTQVYSDKLENYSKKWNKKKLNIHLEEGHYTFGIKFTNSYNENNIYTYKREGKTVIFKGPILGISKGSLISNIFIGDKSGKIFNNKSNNFMQYVTFK